MNTPLKADAGSGSLLWFENVRRVLSSGSLVEFSPKGYSMWPALRPERDTVTVGRAAAYRPGDIVLALCDSPYGVILHRIARTEGNRIILMGDSNLFQTETCAPGAIAGKVLAIRRDGRDVSRSALTRLSGAIQRLPAGLRRLAVRILSKSRHGSR